MKWQRVAPRSISAALVLFVSVSLTGGVIPAGKAGKSVDDSVNLKTSLPLVMLEYSDGTGSVTGTVFDATSVIRAPLGDVSVCYLDQCDLTGGDGVYTLEDIPDGFQHLGAARVDYYDMVEDVVVKPLETAKQDFAMTPLSEITDVFMRVLLTWEETETWPPDNVENDLDAHMWLESPGVLDHIFFEKPGDCTTFPNACLEVDYRKGYGPETLAIRQLESVVYHYGVLNYNAGYPGVPDITQLQAKVRIYQEGGNFLEYNIPSTGQGDFWYVFKIISDGDTANVLEMNCITALPANEDQLPDCGQIPQSDPIIPRKLK